MKNIFFSFFNSKLFKELINSGKRSADNLRCLRITILNSKATKEEAAQRRAAIRQKFGIKVLGRYIFYLAIGIYFVVSILIMNDYLKTHYSWYQKYYCKIDAQEKLKKSVVRVVGGYSEGSGFFISNNQILTNFHVISGEPSPKIIFPDGNFITPTKITGDEESDLAILYTEKDYSDFVFTLPDEINFKPEEQLMSAGYPLGSAITGNPTVVKGNYLDYRKSRKESVGYIQTDFGLVEGMSGGPLTDICGNVVGINTISMSGQSLFIAADIAKQLSSTFTDQEITKIDVDSSASPMRAVEAFYTYLKARRMKDGYDLLSVQYKKNATYEEWTSRFVNILDVDVVLTEQYDKTPDKVRVKFRTKNWVNGEVEYHHYEGVWKTVIENNTFKLTKSDIEEIADPDVVWFFE